MGRCDFVTNCLTDVQKRLAVTVFDDMIIDFVSYLVARKL